MPVALILVDALSAAYPSETVLPFLRTFFETGLSGSLENMYAYRGIEATLFSGRTPLEHGVWGEYQPILGRVISETPLERCKRWTLWAGDLLPSDRLRLDARYVIRRLGPRSAFDPVGNLIPADTIQRFEKSIERPVWEPNSLETYPTLFDEIRASGLAFETVVYPRIQRDEQIGPYVGSVLARRNLPDFWYIKFSVLDALGHLFGPDVARLRPALERLNQQLAGLIGLLRSGYGQQGIDILVVADHGMSRVTGSLDVKAVLRKLNLKPGQDYLYFLDSTTLRFWSAEPATLERLRECFANLPGLHLLNKAQRDTLKIPNNTSTGDLIFGIDEGKVIFPDFFRKERVPTGMHGYAGVTSHAGLPHFSVSAEIANLLGDPRGPFSHLGLWKAMRTRLQVNSLKGS